MFKKFAKEFKEFALQGNVVDMAIGVIIGAAFKDIVTSFTDNFTWRAHLGHGGLAIARRQCAPLRTRLGDRQATDQCDSSD